MCKAENLREALTRRDLSHVTRALRPDLDASVLIGSSGHFCDRDPSLNVTSSEFTNLTLATSPAHLSVVVAFPRFVTSSHLDFLRSLYLTFSVLYLSIAPSSLCDISTSNHRDPTHAITFKMMDQRDLTQRVKSLQNSTAKNDPPADILSQMEVLKKDVVATEKLLRVGIPVIPRPRFAP
jgi:hypothetical protein